MVSRIVKTLLTASLGALMTLPALAREPLSPQEIARLPKAQVERAQRQCAERWPDDYAVRVYCEDQQFQALKTLIERGSEKSQ